MMVEGRVLKGKGTSEPMSTSGCQLARLSWRQGIGDEHHGRDAHAAAQQQRARFVGMQHEGLADGAQATQHIAALAASASKRLPSPTAL